MTTRLKKKVFEHMYERMLCVGESMVKPPIRKMLDTGYGDGKTTMRFAHLLDPMQVYGLDIHPETMRLASRRIIKRSEDLNNPFSFEDDQFDFLLSNQVIEHLINVRKYLSECYRVLRSGGQILIMTESLSSLLNIACLALGWQPFSLVNHSGWIIGNPLMSETEGDKEYAKTHMHYYDDNNMGLLGHVGVFTPRAIRDMMVRTGFVHVSIKTVYTHFVVAYGKKP